MRHALLILLPLCLLLAAARPAAAIAPGQLDDFQSGDANGWGWPAADQQPAVIASGGPAGAGDGYLEVFSLGGFGINSRMAVINRAGWAGDYLAADITGVSLDLLADPTTDLSIRISLSDQTFQAANRYSSNEAYSLVAGSGWNEGVFFPIDSAALGQASGSGSLDAVLASVVELRVLSSVAFDFKGDQVAATIGLDNIRAVGAEPPPAGDYNADGVVDAADYTVWRDNLGADSLPNDNQIGGPVGAGHYELWRDNYQTAESQLASATPEPNALGLGTLLASTGLFAIRVRPPHTNRPTERRRHESPLKLRHPEQLHA